MQTAAVQKSYHGFRDRSGTCLIEVRVQGQPIGTPLKHEMRHSPTGFEWGYGGSGPADTARSILADHLGYVPTPAVYQRFKALAIQDLSQEPEDAWTLTSQEIELCLSAIKADLGVDCPRCGDSGFIDRGSEDDTCPSCTEGTNMKRALS